MAVLNRLLNKYFLLCLTFLFIPLATNVKRSWDMFLNTVDFSIYQQALYEIAAGNSYNPYLTVRNIKILNDHFDPAVYLGAAWVFVFGESVTNLMVFEWLWFFFAGMSIFYIAHKEVGMKSALFALFLYTFSRGALQGVEFPIHPTTWSLLPCVWAIYFLIKKDYKKFVPTFFFLCLFREMYYFSLFGVFLYFLLKKKIKPAAFSFVGFIGLIIILLKFRPWLLGPTLEYDNGAKAIVFGLQILTMIKKVFEMNYTWQIWFPALILIPMGYYFSDKRKEYLDQFLKVFFFILPGFGIHIIVGRMYHHQSIPFSTPLYVFIALQSWDFLFGKKKIFVPVILAVILCGSSRYTKMVKFLFNGAKVHKINFSEKRASFEKMKPILKNLPLDYDIIGTGSVVPFMVASGRKIYQFCDNGPFLEKFDVVVVEKNHQLIANPLDYDQVDEIERDCRAMADEVLFEDDFHLILKGEMTQDCTKHRKFFGPEPKFVPPGSK